MNKDYLSVAELRERIGPVGPFDRFKEKLPPGRKVWNSPPERLMPELISFFRQVFRHVLWAAVCIWAVKQITGSIVAMMAITHGVTLPLSQ